MSEIKTNTTPESQRTTKEIIASYPVTIKDLMKAFKKAYGWTITRQGVVNRLKRRGVLDNKNLFNNDTMGKRGGANMFRFKAEVIEVFIKDMKRGPKK